MPDHRRIGISSNVFASEAFQFDRFFDEFETVTEARRFPRGVDPVDYISPDDGGLVRNQLRLLADSARHDQPLRSGANAALAYADSLSRRLPVPRLFDGGTKPLLRSARQKVRRTDGPFFLFVNFMESHLPLEPTAGYDESLYSAPDTFSTGDRSVWELLGSAEEYPEYLRRRRGLYGASIDYLDRHVSEFIADLREETDRETTVVVTADHGENLGYPGDGGLVRHKSSLSEGLLHVPCDIVNPPDGAAPPTGRFTSHLDFDTLLPALGRGEFPDIGREAVPAELVGLSAGPNPDPEHEHWDRMIRTVLHGDQKEIRDSTGRTVRCDLDPDRPSWQGPPRTSTRSRRSGRSSSTATSVSTSDGRAATRTRPPCRPPWSSASRNSVTSSPHTDPPPAPGRAILGRLFSPGDVRITLLLPGVTPLDGG
ncbi:sulfatase-like hydrolase/transferase [Halosimplex aquaticum]